MKKLQTIAAIMIIFFAVSCNNKSDSAGAGASGAISPTAQKNLDAMHGVTQCFESKDFSKLGDYITADAVDHAGDNGDIKGLDSLKVEFAKWAKGVTQKSEIIKELADDEYVMSWEHTTGTFDSAMMGHKAGDKLDMKALEIAKFKDGKATEHWSLMEPGDVMKMMASMPPMPKMAEDASKMAPAKK